MSGGAGAGGIRVVGLVGSKLGVWPADGEERRCASGE